MLKSFKNASVILLFLMIFISVSCLTDEEKQPRTLAIEQAEIDQLLVALEDQGYDIDTTDLGVYYIVHEPGEGISPQAGDTISIEYTGAFIDGTVFDASVDHWLDGIWEFVYLDEPLISGFNDALSIMKKGTVLDAIIPSPLAYGPYGSSTIPGYTTLLFSLKLHDIKPKSD